MSSIIKMGVLGMASSALVELARFVDSPISVLLPTQETNAIAFGVSAALVVGAVAKSAFFDSKVQEKEDKFAFPTRSSNIIVAHSYIYDKKYIKDFLERMDIPEKLRGFVRKYISMNKSDGMICNLDYPSVAFLSDDAMRKCLEEYESRYGIHIEMCAGVEELPGKLKGLKNNPPSSPFGLIVMPQNEEGHVTPLLCHFTKDMQQVVIMDALGANSSLATYHQSIGACRAADIDYRNAFYARQADAVSCRTSAVILLRNALLDIKDKQKEGSFIDIFTMTQLWSNPPARSGSLVTIPCGWDCHDQITNRSQPADEVYMPRRRFSKSEKPPMTVKECREHHSKEATFEYLFYFYNHGDDPLGLDKLIYPPDVKVEIDENKKLTLTWRQKRQINNYLVNKAQRIAIKYI